MLRFFTRLELEDREWVPRHWPPNLGASKGIRTIPHIHNESVNNMLDSGVLEKGLFQGVRESRHRRSGSRWSRC